MLDGRVRSPTTAFSKSPKRGPRERKECPRFLAWLRTLPCVVSGMRYGIEAAHIRFSDAAWGKINPGIQRKPDDKWALPLTAEMHRLDQDAQHNGNERKFWERHRIDPLKISDKLWTIFNDETLSQVERDEAGEKVIRGARL
jgi:hypothetical protein